MTPTSPPMSGSALSSTRKRKRPTSFVHTAYLKLAIGAIGFSVISLPFIIYSSLRILSLQGHCGDFPYQERDLSVWGITGTNNNRISPFVDSTHNVQYTLDDPPIDSPYHILHTVTTRFMVGQPKGLVLAKARYLLFETFCWPTMRYQTNQNYYWVVLVDPRLDPTILRDIQALLNSMPSKNAYMVLTNNTKWVEDGVGVENATSYGVGLQTVVEEFRQGQVQILTGNAKHLHHAFDLIGKTDTSHNDGDDDDKPILVMETLLDADDGMNNHAIDWIQELAIQKGQEQQRHMTYLPSHRVSLSTTWWLLCGTKHIEWHNRDIFIRTEEKYKEFGVGSGLTGTRTNPFFCTSAGFTRIGLTHPSLPHPMDFPKEALSNHAIAFYFPHCTDEVDRWVQRPPSHHANISLARCYRRVFPNLPFILKSRSITSDSMENMNAKKPDDYRDVAWLNKTENPLLLNETETIWDILKEDFSIDRRRVWEISMYLFEHRRDILRQNMASRCIPGFPCNKGARKNLLYMERFWARQEEGKSDYATIRLTEEEKKHKKELALTKLKEKGGKAPDDNAAVNRKMHDLFNTSHANMTDSHKKMDAKKKAVRAPDVNQAVNHMLQELHDAQLAKRKEVYDRIDKLQAEKKAKVDSKEAEN
jgi:hypothetical protein